MNGANQHMSVTVPVPGIPPNITNRRIYKNPFEYKKMRDSFRHTIYYLVTGRDRAWLTAMANLRKRMRLDVTLMHKRLYDVDAKVTCLKPILDSMVTLGFLAGDTEELLELNVTQEKINANETILVITEARP
jgi:hypothetical protein